MHPVARGVVLFSVLGFALALTGGKRTEEEADPRSPPDDDDPPPLDPGKPLEVFPGAWEVPIGRPLWLRGGGQITNIAVEGPTEQGTVVPVSGGLMHDDWIVLLNQPGTWTVMLTVTVHGSGGQELVREWTLTAV